MPQPIPLISIVGTTATGKTDLALAVARAVTASSFPRQFKQCILISADSRQVYQGIELLSGADIPSDFTQVTDTARGPLPFWENGNGKIELHGVSCISPLQPWSAAHFTEFSRDLLQRAAADNILPVVVGGTGFYHQQLLNPAPTQGIAPDPLLREQAVQLSVPALQKQLADLAPEVFAGMNNSDAHNKRRLVRAIEVASAQKCATETLTNPNNYDLLAIGLTDTPDNLSQRITKRVAARLDQSVLTEVALFMQQYPQHPEPVWTATGLAEIAAFLEGKVTKETCIAAWTLREIQYAKRQLVWWKKRENITWFSMNTPDAHSLALQQSIDWLTESK